MLNQLRNVIQQINSLMRAVSTILAVCVLFLAWGAGLYGYYRAFVEIKAGNYFESLAFLGLGVVITLWTVWDILWNWAIAFHSRLVPSSIRRWMYHAANGTSVEVSDAPSYPIIAAFVSVWGVVVMATCWVPFVLIDSPKWYIYVGWASIGYSSFVFAKRLRPASARHTLQHGRPFVLYLRCFFEDQHDLDKPEVAPWKKGFVETTEQKIATVFRGIGEVIAIGRPHERVAVPGASRVYVPNASWRAVVSDLISRASLVVIRTGWTDGLNWEIDQVLKTRRPEELILFVPFGDSVLHGSLQKSYDAFRTSTAGVFLHPLPERLGKATAVYFDSNWLPHVLITDSPIDNHPFAKELQRLASEIPPIPAWNEFTWFRL